MRCRLYPPTRIRTNLCCAFMFRSKTESIDMQAPTSPLPSATARWKQRLEKLQKLATRLPWLLPLVSFAAGWIGFVMVRRGAEMARYIAALAILGWLWLLIEPLVRRYMERIHSQLTGLVVNFITQSIQQELLFFSLPFLVGALQLDVGQIIFTALVAIAALVSTVDPLFERHIAGSSATGIAFHAYCTWIAALVALPMVAHVPLERALPLACALTGAWIVLTLPKLWAALRTRRKKIVWITCLLLAPLLLWSLRGHVPAAGLSVTAATVSRTIEDLVPGAPLKTIDAAELSEGVIAFVAIRAPMGVAQSVVFEWRHGDYKEAIASEIRGGGKQGWRTYSRKSNFPVDSQGKWTVDVLTPQGQLLKRMRFTVL
jgi:hypothetical protein